ncbi:MAG: autotransporter outer membrane beta-barrel domain-containing protein [Planctomycetia bacterium]|nr:autotransporter outer membrane beta-barrel domain-containing protein [Planctomycetia bacterium]
MKRYVLLLYAFMLVFSALQSPLCAQFLYTSSPKLGLQSATLENIMVLQTLRDADHQCPDRHSWFTGYGAGGNSRGDVIYDNESLRLVYDTKYDESFGGFLLGTDANLSDDCRLGAFFAYNSSVQTETQNFWDEKTNVDNYFWGLYGRKDIEGVYFLGTAAIGHSHLDESYESQSPLVDWQYSGESNAWRAFVYGEMGTEYRIGSLAIQPFWGLQYYYSSFGSFSSTSSPDRPLMLTFPALRTNSFRNVLGIRLASDVWQDGDNLINLNCAAFWFHEFLDLDAIGGGTVVGVEPPRAPVYTTISQQNAGRDWVVLTPTFEWKKGAFRLWAGYIALFNERETIQMGQGGVGYCW